MASFLTIGQKKLSGIVLKSNNAKFDIHVNVFSLYIPYENWQTPQ